MCKQDDHSHRLGVWIHALEREGMKQMIVRVLERGYGIYEMYDINMTVS